MMTRLRRLDRDLLRSTVAAFALVILTGAGWLAHLPGDSASGATPAIAHARQRGELRIGVDYVTPPLGPTDFEVRTPDGFEPVLADELAAALDTKVVLVGLGGDDPAAALSEGRVDLLLVHLPARASLGPGIETVDVGYRTGLMPLMRSDTAITTWDKLAGRVVCVADGNAAARVVAERHGAFVRVLKAPAKALAQMRTGDCDAAIDDEAVLEEIVKQPTWQKYSATLPVADRYRLVFAVRTGDRASFAALRDVVRSWSSGGNWLAWEQKWAADVAFETYLEQDAPDCH
jgi:polar amino acid transport system substrate-binding protein